MAAKTPKLLTNGELTTKNGRLMMNKLRDSGLEYVSSTGKLIAAKTQPGTFCHCPQKCKKKLPNNKWERLFQQFYSFGDQTKQNQFLQAHIVIKAVHLHNWEGERTPANRRRVTCKYHVPDLDSDTELDEFVKKKGPDSVEVCQKAFMNIFGITEKRVRMQRERCISKLAPDHYKNSPFGKKVTPCKTNAIPEKEEPGSNTIEFANGLEITPLDLSSSRKDDPDTPEQKAVSEDSDEDAEDVPLDLSGPKSRPKSPHSFEIDKSKLYEIADKMGLSRERIEKEMAHKYEQMVRQSLKKQQQKLKNKVFENGHKGVENRRPEVEAAVGVGISEQVVGLGDDLTILPIQTLNNGDLTITPVLGPVSKPVENGDIMRVNYFFQNQLWKPEYTGLSNWKRLLTQSYDV